ncbi:hypothetical protein [Marinifilum flexuosum]|uniref:Lipoprotein n=1 Tax=Marinifilum flexuosum TaxID=1117708 RepID=A0A419X753_9BACT|nr:hypothetical protein [Marinifilum flexuosum]RKE03567.1 hypothetical protein BXY64_0573 [Marinifilum flexuosum]
MMRFGKKVCYLLASMLVMYSCNSNEHELEMNLTNAVNVEENAMVNSILENILNEVEYNMLSIDNGTATKQDSIPFVKIADNNNQENTKTLSINYGQQNSIDYLGKLKRGRITTQIEGEFKSEECCYTVSFEQYYINNLNITGSIKVDSRKSASSENLTFDVTFEEILFTDEKENTYSLSGKLSKEWIEGYETSNNHWDDQFFISGTTSGINSEGREYQSEILTPLLVSHACEFIASGEVLFTAENESCTYSYGNGLCDNKGFFTKDGQQYPFEYGRYQFRYQK